MARSAVGDLDARLRDPGFTPADSELSSLLDRLAQAEGDDAPKLERVIARAGARALDPVLELLATAEPAGRARLIGLLGRIRDGRAGAALRDALQDPEPRVRRRAASALGRLPAEPDTERALVAALDTDDLPLKRAVAEALGKVGGRAALTALTESQGPDPELTRRRENALALIERRDSRDAPSHVRLDRPLGEPIALLARCRAGLSSLLAEELASLGRPEVVSPTVVELRYGGTLSRLLSARIALEVGARVPLLPDPDPDLGRAIARSLDADAARRVFACWTEGTPRFRLAFADGAHRRAVAWSVARAVSKLGSGLINDSRGASWEVFVADRARSPHLVLVPRGFDDPRFAYRTHDVPAASHPTIAAALARAAGARPTDVVWDPFVGSALELVERARLGPYARLIGSDVDERALGAARANLKSAGVPATLELADARSCSPAGVTLILTNPPMGRRLARDGSLGSLLEGFLAQAARVLRPGGRLVWLNPLPELGRRRGPELGFELTPGPAVDVGGFDATLEVLTKRR